MPAKSLLVYVKEHHHRLAHRSFSEGGFHFFFVLIIATAIFFGFSSISLAQGWMDSFDPLTLPRVFARLSCYVVRFALITVAGAMMYAGISFLLARGNPTLFEQSKKIFQYALLGGIIIYGVYTLIMTIGVIIGATDLSFLPLTCS